MISDSPEGEYDSRLSLFGADGTSLFTTDFTYAWQKLDIEKDMVLLYNDNSCRIYGTSGKERFAGEFEFPVSKITRGKRFNSLIVSGGDRMRELRLK